MSSHRHEHRAVRSFGERRSSSKKTSTRPVGRKRLELLKDLLPRLSRVGILGNTTNPFLDILLKRLRPLQSNCRSRSRFFEVRNKQEIEGALRRLVQARPDGVLVSPDLVLVTKRSKIAAALTEGKLPAIYPFREYAAAGGLIVHGANLGVLSERAAGYVDRIVKAPGPPTCRCSSRPSSS